MVGENEEKLIPQTAGEYFKRGYERFSSGDFDGAIADYTEAISLSPNYVKALAARGRAWNEKNDPDSALADLNDAINLKPEDVVALVNRGYTWILRGEWDRAIEDCNKALSLEPSFQRAVVTQAMAIALKSSEPMYRRITENIQREYSRRLKKELKTAIEQITEDTKEFRNGYKSNLEDSNQLRAMAIRLLCGIGFGAAAVFVLIYFLEKGSLGNWGLIPWIPVVTAISAPFFVAWWMLQRWSFELKTLAYGFHRKAILEERILLHFRDDRERLKDLQKIYIVHWMEKSLLEVMLTIGGKNKDVGKRNSPVSTLLESAENIIRKVSKGTDNLNQKD